TISAQRHMEPAKLTKLVRGELDWIVMKMLEKDRNRRYETASGLASDVERYLKDEPVLACPPSAWYRFRKFGRRHKAGLGMGTAAALLVLLAVVLLAVSNVMIGERERKAIDSLAAETKAKGELQDSLEREYFQQIARAQLEWWNNNVVRADQILDDCLA